MKVEIEDYRGWTIYFDTDEERFYSVSQSDDVDKNSKSFSAAKKGIDDYIKENPNFRHIKMMVNDTYVGGLKRFEIVTIIGRRKDGGFIATKSDGEQIRLSKYDESRLVVWSDEYTAICNELLRLDAEWDEWNSKHKAAEKERQSKLNGKTLKDIRRELTGKEE